MPIICDFCILELVLVRRRSEVSPTHLGVSGNFFGRPVWKSIVGDEETCSYRRPTKPRHQPRPPRSQPHSRPVGLVAMCPHVWRANRIHGCVSHEEDPSACCLSLMGLEAWVLNRDMNQQSVLLNVILSRLLKLPNQCCEAV